MNETTIPDERLELIFTCCHPALELDAQAALTLRTLLPPDPLHALAVHPPALTPTPADGRTGATPAPERVRSH